MKNNVVNDSIELNLPSEFASADLHVFSMSEDVYLLSAKSISDIGIWEYKVSTNTFTKKYSLGKYWSIFQKISDTKCLISSPGSSDYGLLLYNLEDGSITKIYESGYNYNAFKNIGNKWLISSPNYGVFYYNLEDDSVGQLSNSGDLNYIQELFDGKYLIGGSDILLYNPYNNDIRLISEEPGEYFQVMGYTCLISSSNYGSCVLLFDSEYDEITKVFDSGSYWKYFQVVGNKCLISSSNSSSTGVLLFDSMTYSVSQVYSSGYGWKNFKDVGGNFLITGDNDKSKGVLLYESSSGSITQVFASGTSWKGFLSVGDKCLIFREGGDAGFLVYDLADGSITQQLLSFYIDYYYLVGDYCLLSFDPSTVNNIPGFSGGVYLYNSLNNTVNKIFNSGYSYYSFEDNYFYLHKL